MFTEIEKNKDLLQKYSKYQIINIAFLLLKQEIEDMKKYNQKFIITEVMEKVIEKLANNEYSQEQIDNVINLDSNKNLNV